MSDVSKAIHRAGAALGWHIQDTGPGHIVGTLHLRDHVAVVDIAYDTKSHSIKYKDSGNLQYNADKREIHKNYNGWDTEPGERHTDPVAEHVARGARPVFLVDRPAGTTGPGRGSISV